MKRPLLTATALPALIIVITGCSAAQPNESAQTGRIEHVHGIAEDPRGDDLLVATHDGVFIVTLDGNVTGPVGGHDFDAMGFIVTGNTLFASGHPGQNTPAELGAPNLGIIRSDDHGLTWTPIALNGTTDFHVLTAAPDGTLYGVASSQVNVLSSTDDGKQWTTRAPIAAADLAATSSGLYAAAEQGLLVSTDGGDSFTPVPSAPLLYAIDARPDGRLVGAGTDGGLWAQEPSGTWQRLGSLQGAAQALSATEDRILLVDDRGIVAATDGGASVLVAIP
ncbi:F510_1955 family glycosylhydrolase [Microbacterium esteraromaticum]|jgi:hypothetical protein|uniref:F510_1955 family glycosylhydrolase n=1 Tax=Microbacterium esteraromaticum TaxID=57043 RepID=UPI0019575D6D|nr:sialidase family protein [Microbacterium esteraromaticum]MBM7465266.1 photosystem II stability/assembly factor-like uncharacterized protein [Microbacterium esteraromaticum]